MIDTPIATAVAVAPPPRASWKDFVPVIAVLLTVIALFVTGVRTLANVESSVEDNTRRIVELEHRADRRDDQMADLRERIGAMDAKLDLLLKRTASDHR